MAYHSKAMVTFKIVALQKDMGFAKKAFVRISGEIYDSQARRFINSYEVPRLEFPIQTELIEDVGDNLRKSFAHTGSFVDSSTQIFTAVTASAPTGVTATSKDDFMFFRNGMIMEQDALSIEQNSSDFLLTINVNNIGYELDSNEEIIAWGKFNS